MFFYYNCYRFFSFSFLVVRESEAVFFFLLGSFDEEKEFFVDFF